MLFRSYNADKFKELGIPKPEKYSDLFHEKLKGRVAWPDISYGPYAIIGLATEYRGDEMNVDPGLKPDRSSQGAALAYARNCRRITGSPHLYAVDGSELD